MLLNAKAEGEILSAVDIISEAIAGAGISKRHVFAMGEDKEMIIAEAVIEVGDGR